MQSELDKESWDCWGLSASFEQEGRGCFARILVCAPVKLLLSWLARGCPLQRRLWHGVSYDLHGHAHGQQSGARSAMGLHRVCVAFRLSLDGISMSSSSIIRLAWRRRGVLWVVLMLGRGDLGGRVHCHGAAGESPGWVLGEWIRVPVE